MRENSVPFDGPKTVEIQTLRSKSQLRWEARNFNCRDVLKKCEFTPTVGDFGHPIFTEIGIMRAGRLFPTKGAFWRLLSACLTVAFSPLWWFLRSKIAGWNHHSIFRVTGNRVRTLSRHLLSRWLYFSLKILNFNLKFYKICDIVTNFKNLNF